MSSLNDSTELGENELRVTSSDNFVIECECVNNILFYTDGEKVIGKIEVDGKDAKKKKYSRDEIIMGNIGKLKSMTPKKEEERRSQKKSEEEKDI